MAKVCFYYSQLINQNSKLDEILLLTNDFDSIVLGLKDIQNGKIDVDFLIYFLILILVIMRKIRNFSIECILEDGSISLYPYLSDKNIIKKMMLDHYDKEINRGQHDQYVYMKKL